MRRRGAEDVGEVEVGVRGRDVEIGEGLGEEGVGRSLVFGV